MTVSKIYVFLCMFFLGAPCIIQATDVAFWNEYSEDKDPRVYLLMQSNKGSLKEATGQVTSVEVTGDATVDGNGKFGTALALGGHGAVKVTPSATFPGGFICIEAWIKIDRYPEKDVCIVFRPAEVGKSSQYDPSVNVTKGFALMIDPKGALRLETRNLLYGPRTAKTMSPEGVVPVGRWVHVAGISAVFPVGTRRLYIDGKEVASVPIGWGEGLMVGNDEEKKPGPIYIGNNDQGNAGLSGSIDQVRIHRNIYKFMEKEDDSWTAANNGRKIPTGPPYFIKEHKPVLHLPLDGSLNIESSGINGVEPIKQKDSFVPGVRGQAWKGKLNLRAPQLLGLERGAVEFWFQVCGINNCSDQNITFLNTNAFNLYIFASPNPKGAGLCLYFDKGAGAGNHFIHLSGDMLFPGRWYHSVITWKDKDIVVYLNGQVAGRSYSESLVRPQNKGILNQCVFFPGGEGMVDEIYLYDQALTPEEAGNAYLRYREPVKMAADVRLHSVEIKAQYHPSLDRIYYVLESNIPSDTIAKVQLVLKDKSGKTLFQSEAPFVPGEQSLTIPRLDDGFFTLSACAVFKDGHVEPGGESSFANKHFPWEKNKLGITNEIFPPFTPVRVEDQSVSVVSRTYTMNGFGLWDHVISKGRDLLAAPITIKMQTETGDLKWTSAKGKCIKSDPNVAIFESQAISEPVVLKTVSTIEIDGCMKVEMEILPGVKPATIKKMWIEIPLKADEVPLMHAIADGMRSNYSDSVPGGEGVVWDGTKAKRSQLWRNMFIPYVWLGAEERGIAWFGENDQGWITEKEQSKAAIQEIRRENGKVVLRVYLVNKDAIIKEPRRLVFGLQASPTKPMPDGWRRKLPSRPGWGLPVMPWGGLDCASQGPYKDDWRIVDKIIECRNGKEFDRKWFDEFVKENKPPLVGGISDWLGTVINFAGTAKRAGPNSPLTVYQEEMYAAVGRPEWIVYRDEWGGGADTYARGEPTEVNYDTGYAYSGANAGVTFGPSYRDFGAYFANEWLKRGVSLYWDNTFPKLASNTLTTPAYFAEDGKIQPALLIWNQQEYQKRIWNILQENRRTRPEPLEWVLHMTNSEVLPIMTWGTVNLDHELGNDKPFSPEWLRTESIGLQVGNYPCSLNPVRGKSNKVLAEMRKSRPKDEVDRLAERIEWGLRVTHEIQHGPSKPEGKIFWDFGYGNDNVPVHNYWADKPVLKVDNGTVKWIALENKQEKEILMVFASWSEKDTETAVKFIPENLGFNPLNMKLYDAETGEEFVADKQGVFTVKLPAPYGVKMIRLGATVKLPIASK